LSSRLGSITEYGNKDELAALGFVLYSRSNIIDPTSFSFAVKHSNDLSQDSQGKSNLTDSLNSGSVS
jgi:hypothetical protein